MKLYNVPRHTWVKGIEEDCDDIFKLDHIDGMYSYCHDEKGKVRHYSANMEVVILNEHPDYMA